MPHPSRRPLGRFRRRNTTLLKTILTLPTDSRASSSRYRIGFPRSDSVLQDRFRDAYQALSPLDEPAALSYRIHKQSNTNLLDSKTTVLSLLVLLPSPKKFASSKQQLTTKEPESEHLDSSLSRLQISRPSDSPPSDPFDTLLDRFERIVAKPCTPPVAPPRAVDWVGPCCATQYQRDQLAHSFIFDRAINEEATTVKAEVEEDAVFVSDRMGLGCKAISKTDAIELVRLELALRGTPLNPEPEEIVDDQKLFESLDWDEADFADHPRDGLLLSSDSRRPPDPLPLPPPPLADPTPPKHVSGTTAMLSNGPWNAPADEDELSSVDDLHLTSSDSGTATLLLVGVTLNDLGDYEDVSARRTLPRYQTAYEPESIRAVGIEGEEERDSIPNEITGVEEVVEIR
ncbi:hypothetical protein JCM3766R1_005034 [Sporobolomyces carnicolor]